MPTISNAIEKFKAGSEIYRGVTIFDKAGTQIATIPVPDESWTGNLCFGGADRQTLFICASKGFYSIKMSVKGTVFPKPAEK